MLLMTVHVVTWYTFNIHAAGSIGIEALFSGLSRGVINAGVIFLGNCIHLGHIAGACILWLVLLVWWLS
jgi:hypothetical protein